MFSTSQSQLASTITSTLYILKNITFFKVDDIPQKYVDKKDTKFGLATLNSLMG